MWDLLESLQKRPETSRRVYAYAIAGGLTLFIVLLWLAYTLGQSNDTVPMQAQSFTELQENIDKFGYALEKQKRTWQELWAVFRPRQ